MLKTIKLFIKVFAIFLLSFTGVISLSYTTAEAQRVFMISGTILNPPNLVEGQYLQWGQQVTLAQNSMLILENNYPSDTLGYPCTCYTIIRGPGPVVLQEYDYKPSNCQNVREWNEVLNGIMSCNGSCYSWVIFYSGAKYEDGGPPKRVRQSQNEHSSFMRAIGR